VPEGTAPDRLAQEVVGRAAAKVQRLLHYRSLPGTARRHQPRGGAGVAEAGSADGSVGGRRDAPSSAGDRQPGSSSGCGASQAGLLLEKRLLSGVEAARERCKREAILARLQAELPACLVRCAAAG